MVFQTILLAMTVATVSAGAPWSLATPQDRALQQARESADRFAPIADMASRYLRRRPASQP
jgi:hypothetical protein